MKSPKGSGAVSHVLRVSGALLVLPVGNALSLGTRTSDPEEPTVWRQETQILHVGHWK